MSIAHARRSRLRVLRDVFALAVVLVVGASSCQDPTQITLAMSTDVRCVDTKGIAITGADADRAEDAPPSTVSADCSGAGDLGTLVVTPTESKTSSVSFKVVLGVDKPVDQCTPDDKFAGCIVQRRAITYVKHTPLTLPIRFLLVCIGVPCDSHTTCAANGQCVSDTITNPDACEGDGSCFPPGDPSGQDPDAGTSADAAVHPTGASCSSTATCGGASCCWTPYDDHGNCGSCPTYDIVMGCATRADCGGGPAYCCYDPGTADLHSFKGITPDGAAGDDDGSVVMPDGSMPDVVTPPDGSVGPPDSAAPDAALPPMDSGAGPREASTSCQATCADMFVCASDADCPPAETHCTKSPSNVFRGIYGYCLP